MDPGIKLTDPAPPLTDLTSPPVFLSEKSNLEPRYCEGSLQLFRKKPEIEHDCVESWGGGGRVEGQATAWGSEAWRGVRKMEPGGGVGGRVTKSGAVRARRATPRRRANWETREIS
jgi:hypothetical protein